MRTITASEVVKGMRVEYVRNEFGVETVVRGLASRDSESSRLITVIYLGVLAQQFIMQPETEVTVLAEPEPEWVEGAWYWCSCAGEDARPLRRVEGGWTYKSGGDLKRILLDEERITVLGRVLIVDWPGDDVARTLSKWPDGTAPLRDLDKAVEKVADAIRTQGGAR